MGECPDCGRLEWTLEAEVAYGPDTLWCECPLLEVEDYEYSEDEL